MLECPYAEDRLAVFRQNRRRMALIDIRRTHGDDRLAEFFIGDIDDWQFIMARLHDFFRTRTVWRDLRQICYLFVGHAPCLVSHVA